MIKDSLDVGGLNDVSEDYAHAREAAILVFVDRTECTSLRWLKRGFRHCFAAIRFSDHWIICDPLKSHIEFSIVKLPVTFDLGRFYRSLGHIVLSGRLAEPREQRRISPELLTCVSIAKRIIGLRSFWILTPWQLFRALSGVGQGWRLVE